MNLETWSALGRAHIYMFLRQRCSDGCRVTRVWTTVTSFSPYHEYILLISAWRLAKKRTTAFFLLTTASIVSVNVFRNIKYSRSTIHGMKCKYATVTQLLWNANTQKLLCDAIYRMVPCSMILNDPLPRFQDHAIILHWISETAMECE